MYGDGCDFYALKGVVEELLKAAAGRLRCGGCDG